MPDKEVKETMSKLQDSFNGSMIDEDAVLVLKSLQAENKLGEDHVRERPPSVVTDAGGDPLPKDKHISVFGREREPMIPNQKGITKCSRISQMIRIVKQAR